MLINDSAIDEAPLDDVPQPFALLKLGALSDSLAAYDDGRLLTRNVIATAELVLLQELVSSVLRGGGTVNSKLVSDLLSATDAGAFLSRLHGVVGSDGATLLDAMLASRLRLGLSSQSVVTLDLTPLSRYRGALFTDLTVVVDQVLRNASLSRQVSEVASLIDQVISQRVKSGTTVDTVTVSDVRLVSRSVLMTTELSVVDQVLSSVISSGGVVVRLSSDALLVTDGTSTVLLRARQLLESTTVADGGQVRTVYRGATYSDQAAAADSYLLRRLRAVQTSEGVTLLDLIVASSLGNKTLTASEAILVGDQALAYRFRGRTAADTLGLTDQQMRALLRLTSLVESVSFRDDAIEVAMRTVRDTEGLAVSDEALRQVSFAVLYDVRILLGYSTPRITLGVDAQTARLGFDAQMATLGVYH